MTAENRRPLLERFPALRRLWGRMRPRRLQEIRQLTVMDCGAACLGMVLGYHGRHVTLEEVRKVTGVSRDGTTALSLVAAARRFGLRARGVSIDVDRLPFLETGTILHWRFNHYVVFEGLGSDYVDIVDPAQGRRRVTMEKFRQSFTGVALLLEPGEDFVKGRPRRTDWRRYLAPLLKQSAALRRILVLSLLVQLFALTLPLLTGMLVDRVIPRGDSHLLLVAGVGMLSIVVFQFLASLIRGYLLTALRIRVDSELTLGFLEHMVSLSYPFFQSRPTGDLMMRLSMNSTMRDLLSSSTLSTLLDGGMVLLYLAILFGTSPSMGLLVVGLGGLQVLVFLLSRHRQQQLLSQNLELEAKTATYQMEMLSGIQTLKAFGVEERSVQTYSNLFVDVLNVSLARGILGVWVESATSTLRLGSPLLLLLLGTRQVLNQELSTGQMLALNALAAAVLMPLSNLVTTAGQMQQMGSYLERLRDVLETPPERPRDKWGHAPTLTGACELEQVSFRYAPDTPLVVQDISVRVEPGSMVAIVGRSGAGKTTLANLLLGLYLPTSGCVRYDGANLVDLDLQAVRRQMGVVLQSPAFFGSTVRDNITLDEPGTTMDAVVEAAKLAQIHDDIVSLPLSYDTPLANQGQQLSGGQRQRLGMARALVRKPVMLLLDEATSALDSVTEARVLESLSSLRCTRIVIAHRLSTVMSANLILVMDKGRLAEQGTHHELLARGGIYAQLIHAQLQTQEPAGKPPRTTAA
ncbi:peptidase domain-containing ABC transporter [Archangium lansingense]|uniref:peptidase domain-containing ABC transporter n=1 Tax=Archangium lansingense TaxID=2995310 RepID=UPI003B81EC2E